MRTIVFVILIAFGPFLLTAAAARNETVLVAATYSRHESKNATIRHKDVAMIGPGLAYQGVTFSGPGPLFLSVDTNLLKRASLDFPHGVMTGQAIADSEGLIYVPTRRSPAGIEIHKLDRFGSSNTWQRLISSDMSYVPYFVALTATEEPVAVFHSKVTSPNLLMTRIGRSGTVIWTNATSVSGTPKILLESPSGELVAVGSGIGPRGQEDLWIGRFQANGPLISERFFGGSDNESRPIADVTDFIDPSAANKLMDSAPPLALNSATGLVVAVETRSGISGDKTSPLIGGTDIWLLELDTVGESVRQQASFGSAIDDRLVMLHRYFDGTLGLAYSSGTDGSITALKLYSDFSVKWQTTFGPGAVCPSFNGGIRWMGHSQVIYVGPDRALRHSTEVADAEGNRSSQVFTNTGVIGSLLTGHDGTDYTTLIKPHGASYFVSSHHDTGSSRSWSWTVTRLDIPNHIPKLHVERPYRTTSTNIVGLNELTFTLSASESSASIHYTLDGTEPTRDSPKFVSPVTITQSATLRATGFGADDTLPVTITNELTVTEGAKVTVSNNSPREIFYTAVSSDLLAEQVLRNPVYVEKGSLLQLDVGAAPDFMEFRGDFVSGSRRVEFVVERDMVIAAIFGTPIPAVNNGAGGQIISEYGTNPIPFAPNPIRMMAIPAPGYFLGSWRRGIALHPATNIVEISHQANAATVSAHFAQLAPDEATVTPLAFGPGDILVNPARSKHRIGDIVTLAAVPRQKAAFLGWSGIDGVNPTDRTLTVTVRDSKVIKALFSGFSGGAFVHTGLGPDDGVLVLTAQSSLDTAGVVLSTNRVNYGVARAEDYDAPRSQRFYRFTLPAGE